MTAPLNNGDFSIDNGMQGSAREQRTVSVKQKAVRQFLEKTLAQKKLNSSHQPTIGSDVLNSSVMKINLVNQQAASGALNNSAHMTANGFGQNNSLTGGTQYGSFQQQHLSQGPKPQTQGSQG